MINSLPFFLWVKSGNISRKFLTFILKIFDKNFERLQGNIRIALVRNKEIIPLSRGHTLDVLAVQAYQDGRISRQEAVWSMDEKRIWNHLGREGFHEIEICERPIRIKTGDRVLMISKGIFEEVSWGELEDMMQDTEAAAATARRMVQAAENKANPDMDNGSVLLLRV